MAHVGQQYDTVSTKSTSWDAESLQLLYLSDVTGFRSWFSLSRPLFGFRLFFFFFFFFFALFPTADVEVDRVRVIGQTWRLGLGARLDREWRGTRSVPWSIILGFTFPLAGWMHEEGPWGGCNCLSGVRFMNYRSGGGMGGWVDGLHPCAECVGAIWNLLWTTNCPRGVQPCAQCSRGCLNPADAMYIVLRMYLCIMCIG